MSSDVPDGEGEEWTATERILQLVSANNLYSLEGTVPLTVAGYIDGS